MRKALILSLFVIAILSSCFKQKDSKEYLKAVLTNLEKIESVTYSTIKESWAPGDTAASVIMNLFVKEFSNSSDTTIGASYVEFSTDDTTKMKFCYDGIMRAEFIEDTKTIRIDSFKLLKLPFRPLMPPFFNYVKSIIHYILETKDSISIKMENQKDYIYICLTIFKDQQVEFFGKPFYMEKSSPEEAISKYEIWIDNSTELPNKVRREMSHNISIQKVNNIALNKIKIKNFKASDYFQPDCEIAIYGKESIEKNKQKEIELIGKKAPDWILKDAAGKTFSLSEFKSKVVMLQFTSVACGPCRTSIPFLNKMKSYFKNDDFDFAAIECSSKNRNALKQYRDKNAISYKFLQANQSVLNDYSIYSFPVFFILDNNFIIRKIYKGYAQKSSDKEIISEIEKLIN